MNTALPQWCADDTPLVCGAQSWCEHEATRNVMEPPNSVHYAREICQNCDRVLRWIAKPETIARHRVTALRITQLMMTGSLSEWEKGFLRSIATQRKLSPRQLALLDKLCATYLGEDRS